MRGPSQSDPSGGLFENPEDWIRGYLTGDPPLRLAENWTETNRWLVEAVYYDAAYELIGEGRRWEECPVGVQTEYMVKHLQRRLGDLLQSALMGQIDVVVKAGEETIAKAEADVQSAGFTPESAPELFEERQEHHARLKREEWARERSERM